MRLLKAHYRLWGAKATNLFASIVVLRGLEKDVLLLVRRHVTLLKELRVVSTLRRQKQNADQQWILHPQEQREHQVLQNG